MGRITRRGRPGVEPAARGRGPVAENRTAGSGPVDDASGRRPARWRTRRPVPLAMWVCIIVVYPVSALMFRLRYRHADRLPPRGPVLLVANHVSILDPIACARLVYDSGRIPHFLAKQS